MHDESQTSENTPRNLWFDRTGGSENERELADRLTAALARPDRLNLEVLLQWVAAATPAQRRAAYWSQSVLRALYWSLLTVDQEMALVLALSEGSVFYGEARVRRTGSVFSVHLGPVGGVAAIPLIGGSSQMNACELALSLAYRLGQVTLEWLIGRYDGESGRPPSFEDIGWSADLPEWSAASPPAPGTFVFLLNRGESRPWHLVVAFGGDNALSLDTRTGWGSQVDRVKLSDLATQGNIVQCGAPSWRYVYR